MAATITTPPIVRVARSDDLDAVYALAKSGGIGLTNLPPDRAALSSKLASSEAAVADGAVREAGAAIFLIVECDGKAVGTSCIFPRVGAEWPFYSYRLTRQANRSKAVGRLKQQALLNLVNDFDGETEVGGLFIDPAFRGRALGALAARARYLFIAAHRDRFGRRVMTELRGWQSAEGRSPVWESIGRHFYDMDFHEADRTGALNGNQFIGDLGPRYPLYVSLLPQDAQDALGQPHDDGRPAFEMLLAEGFQAGDYVDIFDGGPTVFTDIDAVRTIRDAQQLLVQREAVATRSVLASSGQGAAFRVARGCADPDGTIDAALRQALDVACGDTLLVVPT